jgi:serine/threonine protein kinase
MPLSAVYRQLDAHLAEVEEPYDVAAGLRELRRRTTRPQTARPRRRYTPRVSQRWTVPGYRHIGDVGEDSSAESVLAVHEATGTPVRIRYLGDQFIADDGFLDRFQRRAELIEPNLALLHEYIEGPQGAAVVTEAVRGGSLEEILEAEGTLGPQAALVVLKDSLLGLTALREADMPHGDLRPSDMLVTDDGTTKLVDIGIASSTDQDAPSTSTNLRLALEQPASGEASAAADIHAASAVFYQCLSERASQERQVRQPEATPQTRSIDDDPLPESLRTLVAHSMGEHLADQPRSAAAFLSELDRLASAEYGPDWEARGRVWLAALATLFDTLPRPKDGDDSSLSFRSRSPRKERAGLVAAACVMIVMLGVTALGRSSYSPSASVANPTTMQPALVAGDDLRVSAAPSHTRVSVNQKFVRIWEIRNTGRVSWLHRYLIRQPGKDPQSCSAPSRIRVPSADPGQTITISVTLTASSVPGSCRVDWTMADTQGHPYFPNFSGVYVTADVGE